MTDNQLVRGLGPWQSAAIVVGTIVGTGVSIKTAMMTQLGGSAVWVLAAWSVAGILSFAGAMIVPGYPVVPILFIVLSLLLLVNTITTSFQLSVIGIAITLLGASVYLRTKPRV